MWAIILSFQISMFSGYLLDELDYVCRKIRSDERPFGGIQMVLCGDFFQLPPVPNAASGDFGEFAFKAKCWKAAFPHCIQLNTNHRHDDPQFAAVSFKKRILE